MVMKDKKTTHPNTKKAPPLDERRGFFTTSVHPVIPLTSLGFYGFADALSAKTRYSRTCLSAMS